MTDPGRPRLDTIGRAVLAVASLKVAGGLLGALAARGAAAPSPIPLWVDLVLAIIFGTTAAWLIVASRRDVRALKLAGVLMLTAAAFSNRHLSALAGVLPGGFGTAGMWLAHLQVNALLPYFFWSFVREFPRARPFGRSARLAALMTRLSLAVGLVLAGASLLSYLDAPAGPAGALARRLARSGPGPYWPLVSGLLLSALAFMVWKSRHARREERRRARLFIAALALGLGPLFLDVLLESLVPPFARFMSRPALRLGGGLLFYTLLLSIPLTTAYAVAVHRVMDVGLVVRKAIRYGLARYTVLTVASAPFAALLAILYAQRARPLGEVLGGPDAMLLAGLGLSGVAGLRLRTRLLEGLDLRFFREQYDARRTLGRLAASIRDAESAEQLAASLEREIDGAMHLHSIAVLLADAGGERFTATHPGPRPLPAASRLAALVGSGTSALDVDLELPGSPVAELPRRDRQWLADGGFALLVPVQLAGGEQLAILALGEKRSELPFSAEDRELLTTIAASAAVALERHRPASGAAPPGELAAGAGEEPAVECADCGAVAADGVGRCAECGGELTAARVPAVLAGKFRLVRRLGAGGMGVVYLGEDLMLGRQVAVKSLPRLSPERSLRMRREARAMAAVEHPNLARIHGAETWRGVPILVLEYLEGGTLAERLEEAPLGPAVAAALGAELAGALGHMHRAGLLHRDVKPANIGYSADGTPRLLDFGLARILAEQPRPGRPSRWQPMSGTLSTADPADDATAALTATLEAATAAGDLVGTPQYLSPEAIIGKPPDPSFDLWSLALVLWESLAGRNPFQAGTIAEVLTRIATMPVPPLAAEAPGCPPALAELIDRGLSRRRRRRPQSAAEMEASLRAAAAALAADRPAA